MKVNLACGLFRLWLFFTVLWVVSLGAQMLDARGQIKRATELQSYYERESRNALLPGGQSAFSSLLRDHLSQQAEFNTTVLSTQRTRLGRLAILFWSVPLGGLFLAGGIPWVVAGFKAPCKNSGGVHACACSKDKPEGA